MDYKSIVIAKRVLVGLLVSNGVKYTETMESINIRCPHCGDSKKSRSIRRGGFVFKNDPKQGWIFYYKCLNGGCAFNKAVGITTYLKRFHQSYYNDFVSLVRGETVSKNSPSFSSFDWKKMEEENRQKIEAETTRRLKQEEIETQYFIPLSLASDSAIERHYIEKAISYCRSRMIPDAVFMRFFVAIDGRYTNRIVIPFYRKDSKPSYFQCRSLDGSEPKYLNRYGTKQFYNITLVDWERPVVVTEGAIDSMFFDNSFAFNGISSETAEFKALPKDNLYILLDNDDAGATTAAQIVKRGYYVFMWRKFLVDNPCVREHMDKMVSEGKTPKLDWNDVVKLLNKNQWNVSELIPYFTNNPLNIPYIRGYRNG